MEQKPKKYNLISLFFLTLLTFGIYAIVWLYRTKEDINAIGGKIPTLWFFFFPFFNFYFFYRFATDFVHYIKKEDDQILIVFFFLLGALLFFLFPLIVQHQINKYVDQQNECC